LPARVQRLMGSRSGLGAAAVTGNRCTACVGPSDASHPMGRLGGCAVWRIGRSGFGTAAVTGNRCDASVGPSDASHLMGRLGGIARHGVLAVRGLSLVTRRMC